MKFKFLLAGISIILGWLWGQQRHRQPISLKNAITIITGGASGIGKATAHSFARQGACVVIADLEHQLSDSLKQEFTPYQNEVLFITCDITNVDERQNLIDSVIQQYNAIDILINNAGISKGGAFSKLSAEAIDTIIGVNLVATIHLTQAVLQVMQVQNHGHIVNVSSVNAMMPPPGEAIYSATKAGLNAFSDSLRRELGKTKINVSVVMPALTKTDMLNNISEDDLRQNQLLMPGMALDKPEDVADAILQAIQFNQREVICGGQSTEVLTRLAQLRPSAMDWAFRHVINTEKFMNALEKLGRTDFTEK